MMLTDLYRRKLLIWIIAFGLLVRLSFAVLYWKEYGLGVNVDQKDYLQYAQEILRQGPFVMAPEQVEAFSPPGYPLILTVFLLLGKGNLIVPVIANVVASTLMLIMLVVLGIKFLHPKLVSALAFWAAIYIPFIVFTGSLLKEVWVQLLFVLLMATLVQVKDKKRAVQIDIALAAGCFTFLFHVDERYLLYAPLVAVPLLYSASPLRKIVAFTLLTVLFSSPWLIRNYTVHDRIVVLTERFQSPVDRVFGYNENRLILREDYFKERRIAVRDSLHTGLSPMLMSGRERKVKLALEKGLFPRNFSLGEKILANGKALWSPYRSSYKLIGDGWKLLYPRPTIQNVIYLSIYGILLPFSLLGIYAALRQRNFWVLYFASLLVFHTLIHSLIIAGLPRYRFPLDSLLIILAVFGLQQLIERKNERIHN